MNPPRGNMPALRAGMPPEMGCTPFTEAIELIAEIGVKSISRGLPGLTDRLAEGWWARG